MKPGIIFASKPDMRKLACLQDFSGYQTTARHLQTSRFYQRSYQLLHSTARCSAVPLPHLAAPGPPPSPPGQDVAGRNNVFSLKRRKADQLAKRRALEQGTGKSSSTLQKRFWKNVKIWEAEGM